MNARVRAPAACCAYIRVRASCFTCCIFHKILKATVSLGIHRRRVAAAGAAAILLLLSSSALPPFLLFNPRSAPRFSLSCARARLYAREVSLYSPFFRTLYLPTYLPYLSGFLLIRASLFLLLHRSISRRVERRNRMRFLVFSREARVYIRTVRWEEETPRAEALSLSLSLSLQ